MPASKQTMTTSFHIVSSSTRVLPWFRIQHDHLKFRKVCTRWVPREQKDQGEKMNRMGVALQYVLKYYYYYLLFISSSVDPYTG
jgi:hypothetical protein